MGNEDNPLKKDFDQLMEHFHEIKMNPNDETDAQPKRIQAYNNLVIAFSKKYSYLEKETRSAVSKHYTQWRMNNNFTKPPEKNK